MMMRGNRKNLKIALKTHDDAMAATGSLASKMSTSRQVALEAMTGHHDDQTPFVPPQVYTDLEAAGWTKEAIQNLQRRLCKGVKGSSHKSNITVTSKMNQTLKSGDYSCGNDCSYDGCRNGVSPFAVPPLSQAIAREDNLEHEAFEAATHRTPAESKKQIQGTKAPPPKSLQNAIKHLNNYVVWLEVLVGDKCSHLLAVIRLRGKPPRSYSARRIFSGRIDFLLTKTLIMKTASLGLLEVIVVRRMPGGNPPQTPPLYT
jgi:hypothetical protein